MVEEVGSSLSSADRKSNIGKVLLHSKPFSKKGHFLQVCV